MAHICDAVNASRGGRGSAKLRQLVFPLSPGEKNDPYYCLYNNYNDVKKRSKSENQEKKMRARNVVEKPAFTEILIVTISGAKTFHLNSATASPEAQSPKPAATGGSQDRAKPRCTRSASTTYRRTALSHDKRAIHRFQTLWRDVSLSTACGLLCIEST